MWSQKGDNLSKIARRYYGSDKYVRAIMKRNKLSNADNIELGTTLYLPCTSCLKTHAHTDDKERMSAAT